MARGMTQPRAGAVVAVLVILTVVVTAGVYESRLLDIREEQSAFAGLCRLSNRCSGGQI